MVLEIELRRPIQGLSGPPVRTFKTAVELLIKPECRNLPPSRSGANDISLPLFATWLRKAVGKFTNRDQLCWLPGPHYTPQPLGLRCITSEIRWRHVITLMRICPWRSCKDITLKMYLLSPTADEILAGIYLPPGETQLWPPDPDQSKPPETGPPSTGLEGREPENQMLGDRNPQRYLVPGDRTLPKTSVRGDGTRQNPIVLDPEDGG